MKEGPVVEPSTTPLNRRMEGLAEETENCHPEGPQREFFPIGLYLSEFPSDRRNNTEKRRHTTLEKRRPSNKTCLQFLL
jgi:hypothetical protein